MTNNLLTAIRLAGCLMLAGCATLPRTDVRDGPSLQRALAEASPGTTITLRTGQYVLDPVAYTDSTCGNCQDADEDVPATLGARISGSGLRLLGVHRDSVVIHTRAGYGLLFEDCHECVMRDITVTGGIRDADGRATDAAIVVRRSTLMIDRCAIRDNIGDSTVVASTVVGIAGIAVREGGDVTVSGCDITRNSWDGIALYRGARAHIHDNTIDGVDKAAGGRVGGGRGVGIGLTWDARAIVERNRVTRYWKGIGVFVEAEADVRENIVEDILTWGIALWGPDGATPDARIDRNIVYRTGACGVMIDRPDGGSAPGTLTDNLIVRTGQNQRYDSGEPYCWQRPIARHHVPASFVEQDNVLFDNRQPRDAGAAPPPLADVETLPLKAIDLLQTLSGYPAGARAVVFRELSAARAVLPGPGYDP
jgi:parallel beta-helix repeat protein